jgi:hypothetical protein
MLLSVAVCFWVLFKGKRTTNVVTVPLYKSSVNQILNEKYENGGERLTQKQLLDNTEYVLNAF